MGKFNLNEIQYMKDITFYNHYYLDIIHNRYKQILDDVSDKIRIEEYKSFIFSARNNYSEFIENVLGVKLQWYQKELINIIRKSSKVYYQIMPYRSGGKIQVELSNYMYNILRGVD